MTVQNLSTLIVGGGVGGMTAALCLAQQGCAVEVFERSVVPDERGAGIQLSPNCTRVLHSLGLADALRAVSSVPQKLQFRDWRSGRVISESALGDEVASKHGAPYYHIHRGDLLKALLQAAQKTPKIRLHAGAVVQDFMQHDGGITLEVGNRLFRGDVLIGADGVHSIVRSALWGAETPRFTGYIAWRMLVSASQLPRNLILPMSTVWWGPNKHFVHYYVRQGELINCVCVVEKTGWSIESWTERGEYAELKADFAGWHSDIQQLIDRADRDVLFKWALYDREPMAAWGQGCVTLLGDACHPCLPFMAQGGAMAIEDAAVLAACLASPSAANTEAGLRCYECLRYQRTAGIQNASRRNAALFHLSGLPAWLRNRLIRVVQPKTLHALFSYDALAAVDNQAKTALPPTDDRFGGFSA